MSPKGMNGRHMRVTSASAPVTAPQVRSMLAS